MPLFFLIISLSLTSSLNGNTEIWDSLFSKGVIEICPLKAVVLVLIFSCKPFPVDMAIIIIVIPIETAKIAIFIIRLEMFFFFRISKLHSSSEK